MYIYIYICVCVYVCMYYKAGCNTLHSGIGYFCIMHTDMSVSKQFVLILPIGQLSLHFHYRHVIILNVND